MRRGLALAWVCSEGGVTLSNGGDWLAGKQLLKVNTADHLSTVKIAWEAQAEEKSSRTVFVGR